MKTLRKTTNKKSGTVLNDPLFAKPPCDGTGKSETSLCNNYKSKTKYLWNS